MMENVFEVSTPAQMKFICNAETGNWVLAERCDAEVISRISRMGAAEGLYRGISLILLNVSRVCNFDCTYCLIGDSREEGELMSWEVGKKAIERVMELPEEDRYVIFHGSEPMTNYELVKRLVTYAVQLRSHIRFAIQSNGSLFDEDSIRFLSQNDVYIGVSLDGLKNHQNTTRPYKDGTGSYDDVVKNLHLIRERQGGVGVILVITKDNVNDLVQIVEHFEALAVSSVFLCPVTQGGKSLAPKVSVLIEQMLRIFDRYFNAKMHGRKTIEIENVRKCLINLMPRTAPANCIQCSLGSKYPLVGIDINGCIYPCNYFWGDDRYLLGNIFDDSLDAVINLPQDFRTYKSVSEIPGCSSCEWRRFCGAGCPGSDVMLGRDIRHTRSHYCEYNKTILAYVAKRIHALHEKDLIGPIVMRGSYNS